MKKTSFFLIGFLIVIAIYFIFFFKPIPPTVPSNDETISNQYVVANPCDKYDCTKGK